MGTKAMLCHLETGGCAMLSQRQKNIHTMLLDSDVSSSLISALVDIAYSIYLTILLQNLENSLLYSRKNIQIQILNFILVNRLLFNLVQHSLFKQMLQMTANSNALFISNCMQITDQLHSIADNQSQLYLDALFSGA